MHTQHRPPGLKKAAQHAASAMATSSLAAALLLSPSPASAEMTYVTLPASVIPGVFAAQKTMIEAWTIVGEAFVDDEVCLHDRAHVDTHSFGQGQVPRSMIHQMPCHECYATFNT